MPRRGEVLTLNVTFMMAVGGRWVELTELLHSAAGWRWWLWW